jgi:hypothetical protein
MADTDIRIEVEPFGPDEPAVERAVGALARQRAVRGALENTDARLLAFALAEPARKTAQPTEPDRFRATWFDYTANHALEVDGRLSDPERATVAETGRQPLPNREEFEAAVAILEQDPDLGAAVREGALVPYEAMPPLVADEQPDGTVHRTLSVGLRPAARGRGRHEIVGVDMIRRAVER